MLDTHISKDIHVKHIPVADILNVLRYPENFMELITIII